MPSCVGLRLACDLNSYKCFWLLQKAVLLFRSKTICLCVFQFVYFQGLALTRSKRIFVVFPLSDQTKMTMRTKGCI